MGKMGREAGQFLPLSPAALHILLALAGEDMHGYGIMQEIARQSAGQYKIGPGTLYDNLKKLVSQGLVEETTKRPSRGASRAPSKDASKKDIKEGPRRRYYRVKGLGRDVLAGDLERLAGVLREARMHSARELKARRA
jgi:hypothetical protein